jgi:hypothetical protein
MEMEFIFQIKINPFIKEDLFIGKNKVMVNWLPMLIKNSHIKDPSKITSLMGMVSSNFKMDKDIKGNLQKVTNKALVSIQLNLWNMKDHGKKDICQVLEKHFGIPNKVK